MEKRYRHFMVILIVGGGMYGILKVSWIVLFFLHIIPLY